jgi:hypothetical protein
MMCAVSSINWFVQSAVIPLLSGSGDSALRALIDPYAHASVMFGMEHLAWGVFLGVATMFGGLEFTGGRLDDPDGPAVQTSSR